MNRELPWSDHRFTFVGGMHRSGTTLLASAISRSPGVSGLTNTNVVMDEGQFLQTVYRPGYEMGGVTRWALDKHAYLTESDATATDLAALWSSWSPYWDLSAEMLVEKTPLNITKTRYLQAVFPRSSFVIITRHPITQALAVMKWAPSQKEKLGLRFDLLIENWLRAHEALQRDLPQLEDATVIRYEDITKDPLAVGQTLRDALGIDLDLAPFRAYDPDRARVYETRWAGRKTMSAAPDLRKSREIIASLLLLHHGSRLKARFEDRVNALGYSLDDLTTAFDVDDESVPGSL
ncbi:sulfotransferase [Microbacterium sp. G2-8]|uniref:sulfotransferase family protein n=1 Tax=Microbacterium sp. G2-8 TaxID=2842454 RepID=UPI001C89452F|nr:sulfotransferase [Microbacterium sp. G2-8]